MSEITQRMLIKPGKFNFDLYLFNTTATTHNDKLLSFLYNNKKGPLFKEFHTTTQ
jgi:hypothetical protein